MTNIYKKIKSFAYPVWSYFREHFLYLFAEKMIRIFLKKKQFRQYLFKKDIYSDFVNYVAGIDTKGRVRIPHLEVDIVKGCNLKCKFCSHVSPLRKGFVPTDELTEWFETWSKKIVPDRFVLLGGEPLLHPEAEKVIRAAGRIWQDSQIELVTNGMLIKQINGEGIWNALRDVNAHIEVSKHFDDDEYNTKFHESIECLAATGIPFDIRLSYTRWAATYQFDEQGNPQPFKSDFRIAWKHGCTSKTCPSLVDNKLFRCAVIASMQGAIREKVISDKWQVVNGYQPLSSDCSAYDIFTHLNSGAFPQCSICPEQLNLVKSEEFQRKTLKKAA